MNDRAKILLNFKRMCSSYSATCFGCEINKILNDCYSFLARNELTCNEWVIKNPDKAVEIVVQWVLENPLKTRQYCFLKQHPNTAIDISGTIKIPPCYIDGDYKYSESCAMDNITECEICRKRYWNEVQP